MAIRNTAIATRIGVVLLTLLMTLAGCGGGGSDTDGFASIPRPHADAAGPADGGASTPPGPVTDNFITGSVGDGPIVNARIRVFSKAGALLQETTSSQTADYSLNVKTQGKNYPLTIRADRGTDLVTGRAPDFQLVSAIQSPSTRSISNLNPFSTLVFEAAHRNGGISDSTVAAVKQAVVTRYGFGLDSALFADPLESPINDANIHLIVKSSETLGEMIRRTRDALMATGLNMSGDAVVAALAADLADGWVDGAGGFQSNSRLAAVANVASAAVLIEAMSNQLMVYGVNATAAMDQSIRQVRPAAPQTSTTANVAIPASAFEQAARVLAAAQKVNPVAVIETTLRVVQSATPGMLPAQFAARLPAGIHDALRKASADAAFASASTIDTINNQARSAPPPPPQSGPDPDPTDPPPPPPSDPEPAPEDPTPPPANNPPVISGSPDTALIVGTPWSFTPKASDPDGDSLSFTISGKPAWMSFSSSTGRLYGTPSSSHVGVYSNIRISVSDGKETVGLSSFTLTVSEPQPSTGHARVSWTPPTEREDGTALTKIDSYKIYYGRDPTKLEQVVNVAGGITLYQIENLEQGTWYFAVTALAGTLESAKSSVGTKSIP